MADAVPTLPSPTPGGPDTVVLVHGLWMTPLSWQGWIARYEGAGWTVLAPTWPGMDRPIESLRADTASYAKVGVGEIVDAYAAVIEALPKPPIIIGHSFGGAITQVLLDRGFGAAGVSLSMAPVKGVLQLPISSLRSSFPVLKNPTNIAKAVPLTEAQFHYAFANSLSEAASKDMWERLAIPGPGKPLFQAAMANFAPRSPLKIDKKRPGRAPLLLITGSEDHISPPAINKGALKLYRHSDSPTEYVEFAGRSHIIAAEPGWEDVADQALSWAVDHAGPVAAGNPT